MISSPPIWHDCGVIASMEIPPHWRHWLLDRGSLTQHLTTASKGAFRVSILQQRLMRPQLSEQKVLNMADRSLALIREVLLYGNDQPWVFARSVLPLSSLTGAQRRLQKLDNRPLGALLFADPSMRRGAMQISRIKVGQLPLLGDLEADILTKPDTPLWGRRSVFYIDQKPLLVSEVFLPDFGPYSVCSYNFCFYNKRPGSNLPSRPGRRIRRT